MNRLMAFGRYLSIPIITLASVAGAAPLTIDLTTDIPPATPSPYGPGTTKNPKGSEITADNRSLFLDGKPFIPVTGEFHYARYPRAEWRDELLKMKAGGIDTIASYVFWIHHEEERGKYDWAGQRSLRDFLKLCDELGLRAFIRIGPWCHGEARNGGFPDWVQNSKTGLRSKEPAFLKLVEPFYREQAAQMKGMLWKDGGPVIGVQLDNENDRGDYLLALKEMALAVGIDVPIYTVTGWQGGVPDAGLIPVFGGYSDGFWGGSREDYRREYVFTDVRAVNDLGAQMETKNARNSQRLAQFPYASAEIGGGMMSAYGKRIKIVPANIDALALTKLGSGNNMPGYYMYHGGIHPEGKLSYMHEHRPNQMPVKDYDFQAAIGSAGQLREHYHLLRRQHLFLQDFGHTIARTHPIFPDARPTSLKDFDTLRWAVRWDGKTGFLFYSNQQPYEPLPEHVGVQFELKTPDGPRTIPSQPVTIPSGGYGFWPIDLDCDGVTLHHATAQLLCRVADGDKSYYFLEASDGVPVELVVDAGTADGGVLVRDVKPGLGIAAHVAKPGGGEVNFVVVDAEQARQLYRVTLGGRPRVVLSKAGVLADATTLRLQAGDANDLSLAVFPPVPSMRMGNAMKLGDGTVAGVPDGIFARFAQAAPRQPPALTVNVTPEKPAGPNATSLKGNDDGPWADAAVYKLEIPKSAANRRLILNVNYTADAVRLYVGDEFFNDHYYNGDPFAVALWRIPPADWPKIRLKVLPYSDGLMGRLPEQAQRTVEAAKAAGTIDTITVTPEEQLDLRVTAGK